MLRNRVLARQDSLDTLEAEKRTNFEFLDRIGAQVTGGTNPDETMDLIVTFAQEATKADAAGIFLLDSSKKKLKPKIIKGLFPPLQKTYSEKLFSKRKFLTDLVMKEEVPLGEGIVGRVAETGKPLLIKDARNDDRVPRNEFTGVEVHDLVLVPLTVRGEVLGVLVLVNKRERGPFNETDQRLVSSIAEQAALTLHLVKLHRHMAEKQRIEQELSLARTFQKMLLPQFTPSSPNFEIEGFYEPAMEVGGDYFDYIEIDERHLGIAIGDVSGKGIPGALVMATVRATLQAEARITLSPLEALRIVNERVSRDTQDGVFITMTYGVLDLVEGTFRFCRSGHEPVICCQYGEEGVKTHSPAGIALGIAGGELFNVTEEETIQLSEGTTAVLYTDGVIEAMDGQRDQYGEERLHAILSEHRRESPGRIIQHVVADIGEFTRGLPQHDDITLVVLRWKAAGEKTAGAGGRNTGKG
jgi:sigma-B regulation protein RsbU (phosphoserine phosphatase)